MHVDDKAFIVMKLLNREFDPDLDKLLINYSGYGSLLGNLALLRQYLYTGEFNDFVNNSESTISANIEFNEWQFGGE
jgi:hypothetical protein